MDRAGVTVKEAWVKAKIVCRKNRGTDGVIAHTPPPFLPHNKNLHHADSLKLRLSTSNRNQ